MMSPPPTLASRTASPAPARKRSLLRVGVSAGRLGLGVAGLLISGYLASFGEHGGLRVRRDLRRGSFCVCARSPAHTAGRFSGREEKFQRIAVMRGVRGEFLGKTPSARRARRTAGFSDEIPMVENTLGQD